jgi:thymidylate synthase
MQVLRVGNVCEAFAAGMSLVPKMCYQESSRAGTVLVAPFPIATFYERPMERVLFCARRDANPFFHLMESVWMLAGSQDARWLDRYVGDFSSRFAEDGGLQHGAYGRRWRRHFMRDRIVEGCSATDPDRYSNIDQITEIGRLLREKPETRQAVMAMWDPSQDLGAVKRDIPCNTHVYFRSRPAAEADTDKRRWLDVTVCCRSNDIIWGAYGANAVHMSIMGEVVAALSDMRLGVYYQMSNNWHVYLEPYARIMGVEPSADGSPVDVRQLHADNRYASGTIKNLAAVAQSQIEAEDVLLDARSFVRDRDMLQSGRWNHFQTRSSWFEGVVVPMQKAHDVWKEGQSERALHILHDEVWADDWRTAAREWMQRRVARRARGAVV